jgi:hypothetical protein
MTLTEPGLLRVVLVAGSALTRLSGKASSVEGWPVLLSSPRVRPDLRDPPAGEFALLSGVHGGPGVRPDADPLGLQRVDMDYLRRPALFAGMFSAPVDA